MQIMNKKQDDLDRTIARLRKSPKFEEESQNSETEYQVGRQLISARIANNLTQQELAKLAGTTQAVISRIESMSVSPSIQLVDRIARALGKTLQIRFV